MLNTKINNFLENNKDDYHKWLINNNYGGVHIKLLPYLSKIDNGFFVEAGAHDGIFQSNSLILEGLGWDGLLIEPSFELYEKCKENRKSKSENYALVSSKHKNKTIKGSNKCRVYDNKNSIVSMGSETDCEYPTIDCDSLFKKYGIKKVDIFSLDVEGFEFEVLNGIDFKNIDITYFLIEVNSEDYSLESMDNFMMSRGYKNICNLSNFTKENCPSWPGTHNDYLYEKT